MNRVLYDIQQIIQNAIKEYLPNVLPEMLEENGKIYYMNGKNGTEFDWFVNEHLSTFMVFYNDKDNLGAAKATVYVDGGLYICLFDNHGKDMIKEINTCLDVGEDELLKLAVCLRNNADDKRIWDADVELIESDIVPNKELIDEFLDNRKYYEASISRKKIMGQTCIVSKKITREGCKVGYMLREDPQNERDSGWWFASGTEDDEYVNNTDNLDLCVVNSIIGLDPVIIKYIDSPVGTSLIRKTDEEFEEDNE